MPKTSLKPGTRGLVRAFRSIKESIGSKHKVVKDKKYRSVNVAAERSEIANNLKKHRTLHKANPAAVVRTPKKQVLRSAALLRKATNQTGL